MPLCPSRHALRRAPSTAFGHRFMIFAAPGVASVEPAASELFSVSLLL
jgi:hypothetical protein